MSKQKNDRFRGIVILIVVAVIGVLAIIWQTTRAVIYKERKQQVITARYTATSVEAYMTIAQGALNQLAKNPALSSLEKDKSPNNLQDTSKYLTSTTNNLSNVERLGIYDKNGLLLTESIGSSRTLGNGLAKQPFFKTVLKTNALATSNAIKSPITDRQTMAVAVPMRTGDNTWGVLVALLNFGNLRDFFGSAQGGESFTTITDKNGGILLDTRQHSIPATTTATGIVESDKRWGVYETNDQVLNQRVTRSYINGPTFITAITRTNGQVYALSRQVLYIVVLAASIAVLVLAILFWSRAVSMSGRLNDLIQVVQSINKGGAIAPVDEKELTRKDDIGQLAQEIDRLTKKASKNP